MKLQVSLSRATSPLRGGLGASWHAIETGPRQGAGSAWGGNPPAEDDAGWQSLYQHADWLGFTFYRAEFEQRMYQPQRDRFSFDGPEMAALYRILDYGQSRGAHVMLQQMWSNVQWNCYPGVNPLHSAPIDLEAFAHGLGELVHHLLHVRGYACIKWLCINNEPGCGFSWWQGYGNQPLSIAPGLRAVRRELDRRKIDLPLMGPDYTGLTWNVADVDYDDVLGGYDLHTYTARFDFRPTGQSDPERNLVSWVRHANARGKPLMLSEFGSFHHGWQRAHPGPGTYPAAIDNAEIIIRGLNLGVEGFNRWSYTNLGDLDGQFQLVDTWDIERQRLRARFTPHPNIYAMFGLLARFLPAGSQICSVTPTEVAVPWFQSVHSVAARDPAGNATVWALNLTEQPERIELAIEGLAEPRELYRYRVEPSMRDMADARLDPTPLGARAEWGEVLPGLSLTAYSTRRLEHEQMAVGPTR